MKFAPGDVDYPFVIQTTHNDVFARQIDWLRERFDSDEGKQKIAKVRQLSRIADEVGCSMAQLAMAWCLRVPYVSTVITGASRPEQVTENMASLEVLARLTPAVLDQIETILNNQPEPPEDFR